MSDELNIPGDLASRVNRLMGLRAEIEETEEKLKALNAEERQLSGVEIPDYFFEKMDGLTMLKWRNGAKIEIKKDIKASVPKDPDKQERVLYFLKLHGALDLVKKEIVLQEFRPDYTEILRENGIPFMTNQSVNTSSFQALLRDLLGMKAKSVQRIQFSDIPTEVNPFMYYETLIK